MRTTTTLKLSAPPFAEGVIGVSMMVHANVFGFLLAPFMLIAFVSLIGAVAIASKDHEHTSRNTWTWLALAAVAQNRDFHGRGFFRQTVLGAVTVVLSPQWLERAAILIPLRWGQ